MAATTVLAAVICPPGPPRVGWVAIADGIIVEVGDGRPPGGAHDLGSKILAPGFIDLQVNGVRDVDFRTATQEQWRRASNALARCGTTAFCPTFVSTNLADYDAMLTRAAAARADSAAEPGHASILGIHLEGPFLGGAPGAHRRDVLVPADLAWLNALLLTHADLVRVVTLAPEADLGLTATRTLSTAGVIVALGHSTATYDEAIAAADAGATVVTHLFNGMGPFHHREPGLVGAALDDDRLTPTLIADLVHVHPASLRLAIARKANIALVSDVVADDGHDQEAVRTADGRLAGATTLLDRAVGNVVMLGESIERAITMATAVPARVAGFGDRGTIAVGNRADLVALDPTSLTVEDVWIAGDHVRDNPRSSVSA
ncbi:MAG: amidohydrolase family protein [Acidimicrobiia bacterium]